MRKKPRLGDLVVALDQLLHKQEIIQAARPDIIEIPSHLTPHQASIMLEISRQAVHQRIERGTLKAFMFFGEKMVRISDVARILKVKREKR